MNWSVTYRTRNGKKTTEIFRASSRMELFSLLQERGLSAIRIEETNGKKSLPQMPSFRKCGWKAPLFVMLSIVIVCSIIFFVARDSETVSSVDESKVSSKAIIPETSPAPNRQSYNNASSEMPVEKQLSKREQDLKQIRDLYGDNIPDNLKAVVYFLEHPPKRVFKVKNSQSYFRHPSERKIASVAFAEPGSYFVVKPEFDEAFNQDFVNALVDKIEINVDDTDEVKAGKMAMTELKKEIADICRKEGKKPSEIMNEHSAAMFELGRYQRDLEKEIERIHTNPDYSDADVEDFCKAANQLLESKGLPPMPFPDLTRRSIHILRAQRQAEKRAARETERSY